MSGNRTLQSPSAPIEQPAGDTDVVREPLQIPAVCFIEDVMRILRVSRTTIEKLRRHDSFPIPELPSLDKRPRWAGVAVEAFLRESAPKRTRLRRQRIAG